MHVHAFMCALMHNMHTQHVHVHTMVAAFALHVHEHVHVMHTHIISQFLIDPKRIAQGLDKGNELSHKADASSQSMRQMTFVRGEEML